MAEELTVPAREGVRADKFFTGLFDPRSHVKLLAFIVIAAFWLLVIYGGMMVWQSFKPKEKLAPVTPDVITATTATIDKSQEVTTVTNNFGPLSTPFGFGSAGKTQTSKEK